MDLVIFKDFLPDSSFRKTSGDDTLCPSGDFAWIEDGKTLKMGGAQPVLFHTFNDKQLSDMSSKDGKCTAETKNSIVNKGIPQQEAAVVEQTIVSDCGKNKNTTSYVLTVSKLKAKSLIDLKIKVDHANKKTGKNIFAHCTYEK